MKSVEVTSEIADKSFQVGKEDRIREAGGNYVEDRTSRELVPFSPGVRTEIIRRTSMGTAKTYDKVRWHFPEGKDCPSVEAAKIHFSIVMKWLKNNGLLSAEGIEAAEVGIPSDFALTSHIRIAKGNRILDRCYSEWVQTIRYGEEPSVELLDRCLREDA